jgi:hypothetical protein
MELERPFLPVIDNLMVVMVFYSNAGKSKMHMLDIMLCGRREEQLSPHSY